jgi:hypothetical protein
MGGRASPWALLVAAAWLLAPTTARAQQDLGHRVPGALGLYAGAQQPLGLYFGDRLQISSASRLYDHHGNLIFSPGLHQQTIFDTFGVAYTFDAPPLGAHVTAAVAAFGGRTTLDRVNPTVNADHSGVGDLWVQPLELGWRVPHVDIVVAYAFYAPTGASRFGTPKGGLGTGHWTQEFSLGGALYLDRARSWSASLLATYALNQKHRNVDLTPGDVVNVEGGIGKRLFGILDVGVASFAHWQVRDDRGSDVPAMLRGVRARRFAVGPELDLLVPRLRCLITLRYEHDLGLLARPAEQSLILAFTFTAWQPRPRGRRVKDQLPSPSTFALRGIRTVNVVPASAVESTSMFPP